MGIGYACGPLAPERRSPEQRAHDMQHNVNMMLEALHYAHAYHAGPRAEIACASAQNPDAQPSRPNPSAQCMRESTSNAAAQDNNEATEQTTTANAPDGNPT